MQIGLWPAGRYCRLSLRERVCFLALAGKGDISSARDASRKAIGAGFRHSFRGAKDSHMGVGWTGFNQAERVLSSVTPPNSGVLFTARLATGTDKGPPLSCQGITSRHTGISGE